MCGSSDSRIVLRLEMEGSLFRDLHEALPRVFEQDTLSSAKYLFNPGRQEIIAT